MNWKLKYGLTGLVMLIAQGACETTRTIERTKIVALKGVCPREYTECDPGKDYTLKDKCYKIVQGWRTEHSGEAPISYTTYTSSSGCASTGSGYRSSSSSSFPREINNPAIDRPDPVPSGRKGHWEGC